MTRSITRIRYSLIPESYDRRALQPFTSAELSSPLLTRVCLALSAACCLQVYSSAARLCASRARYAKILLSQQLFDLGGADWFAEQVALRPLAASLRQKYLLRAGFHAFGDYFQTQALGQRDGRASNGHVVGLVRNAIHKRAVDLKTSKRKALQITERRVAGAEVIDTEPDAHRLEFEQQLARPLGILHGHALGNFQLERMGVQTCVVQRRGDPLGQFGLAELSRREIYRQTHVLNAFSLPVTHLCAARTQYPVADLQD